MAGKSKKPIHSFVQSVLDERGMTNLSELARAAGVPLQTLRNWSHNEHAPGYSVSAFRLAQYLGLNVEELNERFRPDEHPIAV